jgi:hypothetical protein
MKRLMQGIKCSEKSMKRLMPLKKQSDEKLKR